jgi:hypothetical protein
MLHLFVLHSSHNYSYIFIFVIINWKPQKVENGRSHLFTNFGPTRTIVSCQELTGCRNTSNSYRYKILYTILCRIDLSILTEKLISLCIHVLPLLSGSPVGQRRGRRPDLKGSWECIQQDWKAAIRTGTHRISIRFLSLFSLYWGNESKLMRTPCCVSVYPPLSAFE